MDRRKAAEGAASQPIEVELIAVLAAVADGSPLAMTIEGGRALPSGPFEVEHRSLRSGLRAWVERQTGHPLGYLEQALHLRRLGPAHPLKRRARHYCDGRKNRR